MKGLFKKASNFMNSMTLARRLTITVGTLIVAMLVGQVFSLIAIRSLARAVESTGSASGLSFLGESSKRTAEVVQAAWAAAAIYNKGQAIDEYFLSDIKNAFDGLNSQLVKFKAETIPAGDELKTFVGIEDLVKKISVKLQLLLSNMQQGDLEQEEIVNNINSMADDFLIVSDGISELMGVQKKYGSDAIAAANTLEEKFTYLALVMLLISFVAGFLSIFMTYKTTKSIRKISHDLANQSMKVVGNSEIMNKTSTNLSKNVDSSSSALVQTSASLTEIKSMVVRNAESSTASFVASNSNKEKIGDGVQIVELLIASLTELSKIIDKNELVVQQNHEQLSQISFLMRDIDQKNRVINDIAFQTKLLSFNASIEAARAGDQGRGFSVVAEEVGNLARMSDNAAKEISGLLNNSIQRVNTIIEESKSNTAHNAEKTKSQSAVCLESAENTFEIFNNMSHSVNELNSLIQSVETASKEQSFGIEQITEAIHQIEGSTNSNAEDARKTKDLSDSMSKAANSLSQSVEDLRLIVVGSAALSRKPPKPPSSKPKKELKSELIEPAPLKSAG